MSLDRVVVGVDFDASSLAAARWVARHFLPDAEHVLVHALDVRDPPRYLDVGGSDELVEEGRREAIERLAELQEELPGSVHTEVRRGRPDEVLAEVADDSGGGLIAVGRGSGGDRLLGSTAERLVNTASVPVLMIPEAPGTAPAEILVAVADAPETADVLAWARAIADRHDAGVTVTHVFQPTYAGLGRVISGTAHQELKEDQREQAVVWLEKEVRQAGFPRHEIIVEVGEGDPATHVLDETRAPRPDLVITGSRSSGAVERTLLGSVAGSILRGATQPVLVVRR